MVAAKHMEKLLSNFRGNPCSVGCIGNLMENTGLPNILKAAFGGVDNILLSKDFSNDRRALPMAVEDILRPVLLF